MLVLPLLLALSAAPERGAEVSRGAGPSHLHLTGRAARPSVCVIGAGCSGLTALKALSDVGLEVDGYESGDRVGGNWVFGNTNGQSNIYRSLKVGSGNAAHINQFFCVPHARMLGVTPDDIVKYKLPTHPLKDVDIQRAKDALKNDPFFQTHKVWSAAMEKLLKMGVRAEQQALAKWGLNYVMDVYLPAKLKEPDKFLP